MRGNEIVLSADPSGFFDEGIITDTSKPGTLMEIVPATALVNGRASFRARSQSDGAKGPVCILLPDSLQGKLNTDAYVANTRGFLYWPIAGEELNVLMGDIGGTGDVVTIGDLMGIDSSGTLKANSSYTSTPFQAMESLSALTADALLFCKYLG